MKKTSFALFVFILASLGSSASAGIIGTYVDADLTNTTPGTAITSTGNSNSDDMWSFFSNATPSPPGIGNSTGPAYFVGVNQSVFVALENEPVPVITTAVTTGVNPASTYDVYVVYGSLVSSNWGVDAALHGGTLATYTSINGNQTATDGNNSDVEQYEALVGQISGVSSFGVDIGNVPGGGRGYYDGVAFAVVTPEPGSLTLLAIAALGLAMICRKLRRHS